MPKKPAPKPPAKPTKGKSYQDTKLPPKSGSTMKKSCSCGKKPCVCRG
jgi:hypothetical protein